MLNSYKTDQYTLIEQSYSLVKQSNKTCTIISQCIKLCNMKGILCITTMPYLCYLHPLIEYINILLQYYTVVNIAIYQHIHTYRWLAAAIMYFFKLSVKNNFIHWVYIVYVLFYINIHVALVVQPV